MPGGAIKPSTLLLPAAFAACAALHSPAPAAEAAEVPAPLPGLPIAPDGEAAASDPLGQMLDQVLQSTRHSVRSSAEWLARAVDGSFGDKSFDAGGKVSNGRVDLSLHKRQNQVRELDLRFNARFRLPNLEERVHVFVGNDDERDVVTDSPEAFAQRQRLLESRPTTNSFFAGLKLPLLDALEFRIGVHGPFKPFVQASYDLAWHLTQADVVEFRETVFWTLADHFGSTTVGSYAHAFTPTLAVRWLNSVTITQVTDRFEWNSSLGAYKAMGAQRVLSFEALFSGFQGSGIGVSEYGLQVRWEQPIHETWVLAEIGVGHFWPRPDALSERGRAWGVGATLKMKF
ncbi:MAG: hypothetical protein WA210_22650 [Burkholderiaceae bacterium]